MLEPLDLPLARPAIPGRAYDRGLTVPFWLDSGAPAYGPLPGDEAADVVIVGAGVTGLACARVLAQAGRRVRVLEARRAGSGASGRNGGFALRGFALPYDRARLPDAMRMSEEALQRLQALAGDAFRPVGSLRIATSEEEVEAIEAEHDALRSDGFAVGRPAREELPPAVRSFALAGLFHPADGALEQGRWVRRLARLATAAGAALAEETRVVALAEGAVETERGTVRAEHVVVATDGYSHGLLPELDAELAVVRGQVLATAPLVDTVLPCPVYARWGYDYFQQLPDGRLVVGGRRDADFAGETTREEATSETIQSRITELTATLVGRAPDVTHRWAGLMAFTRDQLPLVGRVPGRPGVWVSAGYSGHGNVLGFACGEAVAYALLGRADGRIAAFSPEKTRVAPPLA